MSAPRKPQLSSLPGIANCKVTIVQEGEATFVDKAGDTHTLYYDFGPIDGGGLGLTITSPDGSICSFKTCPDPDRHLWYATGLVVMTGRVGMASHMYALVRDLLAPHNAGITPSGNVFPEGKALWSKLDPSMQFGPHPSIDDYFELI
jgi:hypothetical protein